MSSVAVNTSIEFFYKNIFTFSGRFILSSLVNVSTIFIFPLNFCYKMLYSVASNDPSYIRVFHDVKDTITL